MIDKARIERIQASAKSHVVARAISPIISSEELGRICTDYLALREIVEELAANEPVEHDDDGELFCAICGKHVGDDWRNHGHYEMCTYARAVALVGAPDHTQRVPGAPPDGGQEK